MQSNPTTPINLSTKSKYLFIISSIVIVCVFAFAGYSIGKTSGSQDATDDSSTKKREAIGSVIGGVVACVIVGLVYWFWFRAKTLGKTKPLLSSSSSSPTQSTPSLSS